MYIDMGERIAGKQDRPSLSIDPPPPPGPPSPVEFFWTYEFSKVQGFLVDLASHGVPEEI